MQAVLGDFSQSLSAAGIASRIVIGFIPVAGQVSDVRDVTAQCIHVDPESGKVSIDVNETGLAMSLIAFMPAGDLLKFGNKTIAKNSPEWIKLAKATAKAMDGADETYLVIKREGKVIRKAIEGIGFDDFYKYVDVGDNLVALETVRDSAKYVLSYIDSAADDVADAVDDAYKAATETGKKADDMADAAENSTVPKGNSGVEVSNYKEALDALSENNRKHILQEKHAWNKVVDNPDSWEDIKEVLEIV